MKNVFGIALLVSLALPVMGDTPAPRLCPMRSSVKGVVHVPIDRHSGIPVVDVWLGDRGPYHFALDTSVKCALIVDKALAKDLAMPHRGTEKILNPATRTMSPYELVGVDRVSLGAAHFADINATVDDIRGPFGVDGIVGFGLFGHVLASLDLGHGELRISSGALPRNGAAVQRLKIFDGVPGVLLQAGGQYMFAAINTEVPLALTVPKALAASLPLTDKHLNGDLRIGAVTLADARVAAIDNFPIPNVGDEFLANAVITFDAAHRRVAVEQSSPRGE